MSFNIGPIKQPLIQKSQQMQNNGGGGNLGYMQQGRKKKEEEEEKDDIILTAIDKDEADTLQLDFDDGTKKKNKNTEETKHESWLNSIVDKIADKIVKKESNPFKNAT